MSSALEDVGFGDVSKTSQRCYLDNESNCTAIKLSPYVDMESRYTGHRSFAYSCLIMCYAMSVSDW